MNNMGDFKFQDITWKLHPRSSETHREWFLVIDDFMVLEKFLDFKSKDLVDDYRHVKSKGYAYHNFKQQQDAIEMCFNMKPQKSLVDDMKLLSDEFLGGYYRIFIDMGIIYICKNTAIRPLRPSDIVTIHNEKYNNKLIFPDYTKKDIKISKWGGGSHWYATVGGTQVERRGKIKWNTPKEANLAAEWFLQKIFEKNVKEEINGRKS